jgi:HEPN domain-containing protein
LPHKNYTSAKNWIRRAKSNLIRAHLPKPPEVFYEDLCYDAQQCVEKSIKGLLTFNNVKFRYVHDIGELLKTLKESEVNYPEEFNKAVILTGYAVETRYPVMSEAVTEEEYQEALQIAEQVYTWIEQEIENQYRLGL